MQNNPVQPTPVASQPVEPLRLTFWAETNVGMEREGNEDSIYPQSDGYGYNYNPKDSTLYTHGRLMVVADGVGGAQAGRASSQWAIQRAVENYYEQTPGDPGLMLRNAIEYANASLHHYLQETHIQTAGCTMSAVVIINNMLYVANVGDSRVYLIRGGTILQKTKDHTLTQQKVDQGIIPLEMADSDQDKSVLTRSMGHAPSVQVDVFPPEALMDGDLILVCSDGLYDLAPDIEIAKLAVSGPVEKAVPKLIALANRNGGYDNISVILTQVGGRPARRGGGGAVAFWSRFSFKQQQVLTALLAALALLVIGIGLAIGWGLYRQGSGDDTPAPTGNGEQAVSSSTPDTPATWTPEANAVQSPVPVSAGKATSTPRATSTALPSSTPTHTPIPDKDSDGLYDSVDQCPTVAGGANGVNGCPDDDGDGLVGDDDQCPAASEGAYGWDGCPDDDNDGFLNKDDMCPGTPGDAEHYGCPPPPTTTPVPYNTPSSSTCPSEPARCEGGAQPTCNDGAWVCP